MEGVSIVLMLDLLMLATSNSASNASNNRGIKRTKMTDSILKIEKILNLSDTHIDIELDRMSDQDLAKLYQDLGEKFDQYIIEQNAANNKKSLEDF